MPNKNNNYKIGIDIGGTKMSAVLFNGQSVVTDFTLATPKDSLDHFLVMIKALIEPLEEKAREDKKRISGIGIGVAGVINYKEKRMLRSPNLSIIDGVKIIEKLEKFVDLPAVMDNDTNCFTRAEVKLGAGQKYSNIYGIIIGTGIGGAWWHNNEIYRGSHGGAGEPGEIVIDFKEGTGLEEAYHKLTQNNPAKTAEEAYRGDILAQKTFEEVGSILGIAFANIVNIVDPEVIIIGGGVVESSDLFLNKAKKSMEEHIMSSESRKRVKILKSKLGKNAGAIGAAMLVT